MPMTGMTHEDLDTMADWANYTEEDKIQLHKNLNKAYTFAALSFIFFMLMLLWNSSHTSQPMDLDFDHWH